MRFQDGSDDGVVDVRSHWRLAKRSLHARSRKHSGEASTPTRKLAIPALVLLAHAGALWSIAHRIPHMGASHLPADDSRAVEIELEPRLEFPTVPLRSRRLTRTVSSPARPPFVEPPPAEAATASAPADQPKADVANDEAARRALAQVLACNAPDAYGLTREQRADCFRNRPPSAPLSHPFDRAEIAAFEADSHREPFLIRTPNNGCEPRVADRASPIAAHGGRAGSTTTGGVGCAWSF